MSAQQELCNGSLTIPSRCSWLCPGRGFLLRSLLKSSRKGHGRRIHPSLLLATFSARVSTRQTHSISPAPPSGEMTFSNHQFPAWRPHMPVLSASIFLWKEKISPLHPAPLPRIKPRIESKILSQNEPSNNTLETALPSVFSFLLCLPCLCKDIRRP